MDDVVFSCCNQRLCTGSKFSDWLCIWDVLSDNHIEEECQGRGCYRHNLTSLLWHIRTSFSHFTVIICSRKSSLHLNLKFHFFTHKYVLFSHFLKDQYAPRAEDSIGQWEILQSAWLIVHADNIPMMRLWTILPEIVSQSCNTCKICLYVMIMPHVFLQGVFSYYKSLIQPFWSLGSDYEH